MSGAGLAIFLVWAFLGAAAGSWHVIALSQGLRDLRFREAMPFGKKNAEAARTLMRLPRIGAVEDGSW